MTLPTRYHARQATHIFGDEAKLHRWHAVSIAYMRQKILNDVKAGEDQDRLLRAASRLTCPNPNAVATRELNTGHDVVAYLSLICDQLEMEPDLRGFLHYGLTSSDLVDNAHFFALKQHKEVITALINPLRQAITKWEAQDTVRAGRTHGQIASPTTLNYQLAVWNEQLIQIHYEFATLWNPGVPWKSMGPVGVALDRTDRRDHEVAEQFHADWRKSTQVIPRDEQMRWAALYLRLACHLENLALLVRLGSRSDVSEVREGVERVGSSAMPHKYNPISSEKVCGLARLARGYFMTIAETVALWEDRDLTNSVVERTAVPDLAATVEYMLESMIVVVDNLYFNNTQADYHMRLHPEVWSAHMQMLAQRHFGMDPIEASQFIRETVLPNWQPTNPGPNMRPWMGQVGTGAARAWRKDLYAFMGRDEED